VNTIDSDPSLIGAAFLRWFEELSDRGIFATDASLVVRAWNPWLAAQTGIPASKAIGTPLFELWPTLVERGLDHHYHDALEGEVSVLSERLHRYLLPIARNISSLGLTEMAQSARIAPLTLDGTVVGTITVIEDVTERVVSERELRSQIAASEHARALAEDASKLKDEFLATLSHEIRTPLNAVLGWARLLRSDVGIKSRTHALEVIERNAIAQLRLVEDLLDMARVVSGKLRLDVKTVVAQDVVQAAIDVVGPAAASKDMVIYTDFDPQPAIVAADADRLQQAVWNLMSNAVKFTPRRGRIDVRVARDDSGVAIEVRDSGEGISREFLPYVFDRFRQADASASRRHGGLGLGLALVRQIVELHGGTVAVESPGRDRGATFTLHLPTTTASARPARPQPASEPSLKGRTVLLVDDNADGSELLATALRGYGARVQAVTSADEALRVLARPTNPPDVLVSDVGMPGTDGYELIRRVRQSKSPASRSLPAIAVTAYANPEDRVRALSAGYQTHLPKPVDPRAVASAIARLLGSS
jgi:signal transduction histidine kinase/ActR/RegA family two-component response regulator